MSKATLCLTNCGSVLTSDGSLLHNTSIVIAGETILGIGDYVLDSEIPHIDVSGRLVTPGLIDAHTHVVFAGNRANEFEMRSQGATYQEIAASGGGIMATVRAVRKASEEELFQQSKSHVEWMLSCGTTTLEAKSGYGLDVETELKMLKVIGRLDKETPLDVQATFLGAHAVPPEFSMAADYVEYICDTILPAIVNQGIAVAVDVFVEDLYFTHNDAERLTKATSLLLRMHVDQFSQGGAELAAHLNAYTADHLEQTSEKGINALKQSGTIPVLLPGSVFALGLKKYPDARKMLNLGLPVVLATDFNPGSSPTPSLPMVMSIACTQMGMTPLEAFIACTTNAADALRLNDRGRIESGALADVVVWDTDDMRDVPYYFGRNLVHSIYKRGKKIA